MPCPQHKHVLLACLVAACSGSAGSLYEDDDPFADSKADTGLVAKVSISDYAPISEAHVVDGERLLLIRSYNSDDQRMYVAVNVDNNTLSAIDSSKFSQDTHVAVEALADSPYLWGLASTADSTLKFLNDEAMLPAGDQISLTVDMCQSSRAWERELFQWMVDLSVVTGEPTRVGIAMTGLWAHRHTQNFQQLLDWQREGKLDITWINHSDRHQLSKGSRNRYHFLTAASIDFVAAVTDLEIMLLSQGQMFSPLFRFPGLVHDQTRRQQLNALSLFPLDANAWLAKGEPLRDGSVVLLHGNGNEAVGIDMFFEAIAGREADLANGNLVLVAPNLALPVLP